MSRDTSKRFEHLQPANVPHDRRFENISLPQISTRNKKSPNMVHYGNSAKNSQKQGRILPFEPNPKELKFMGSRDYSPKFDLVQKNISFKISMAGKRHSEAMAANIESIEPPKKETGAERCARIMREEEEARQ